MWGYRPEVVSFECHDSVKMGQLFNDGWLNNALINARSGNPVPFPGNTRGFQFYDSGSKAILSNVTFRNFHHDPAQSDSDSDNTVLYGMTHSDTFKPQQLATLKTLRYENVDDSMRVAVRNVDTGSSRYYTFVDTDGSTVGTPGSYIIGSSTSTWWNYNASCYPRADWNAYVCPRGDKEIGVIDVQMRGIIAGNAPEYIHIGNTTLWGRGVPSNSTSWVTGQPGISGPTNTGWYFWLDAGAPVDVNITLSQVPANNYIYWAARYPAGTTFRIGGKGTSNSTYNGLYTAAASLSALWASNGIKQYFFDGTHLYLKLTNAVSMNAQFVRDGVYAWTDDERLGTDYTVRVGATCTATNNWCPVTDVQPPPSSYWN
jgi:hypothetical protein